jgi:oligopeptidase A
MMKKETLPLFKDIKPKHMLPAIQADLTDMNTQLSSFEKVLQDPQNLGESWGKKRVEYDFEGVIERLEAIQFPLGYSWGVMGHLMGVKNSDELRKAHDELQPEVIKTMQKVGQSKALFKALTAIKSRKSVWSTLDEAQQRIVDSSLRAMVHSGVGLEGEAKEKFNALKLEQSELSTKFSNNVLDSTKAFKVTVMAAADLEGLPDSAKGLAAQQAVAAGHEGATAEVGPWVLTLDMPSYLPSMQHLKNRDLREKLYRAFVTRASSGEHDNAPLIKRILQIKKEVSSMLGYECFADMSLASKMAPNTQAVADLTEMLLAKAYPAAQRELEEVKAFAVAAGCNDELNLWDLTFWGERLREKQYEFEEEELRAFFPLPSVLNGLFELAERLFGVKIQAADGEAQVWNDSVMYFNIRDATTNEYIASFYLDPYSRPAEKRGGAWMDVCVGKSRVLNKKPTAYLTCNGSPPVGDKPSLMTFREVETLFHEFGHGLQHMLTKVEYGDAAGINGVEWDAVELPSQFMENWCYDKPTLYSFAKHYETGEPLPEVLFEKVKAAKNFQAGLQTIRQLFFGSMDMHLHSQAYDPNGNKTIFDVQNELAAKFTVMPPLPEDRFLCAFGHIFAGGYSAGYFSYKWAEVMSADAFGAFEEVGLDDEAAVKETGRRFRDTVLAMGGGKHPSDVYKAFRGREPQPEALLRHTGLADNTK